MKAKAGIRLMLPGAKKPPGAGGGKKRFFARVFNGEQLC